MEHNTIETELDSMMHQLDMAIEQGMKQLNNTIMCEDCTDAVASHKGRQRTDLCYDCFSERYD